MTAEKKKIRKTLLIIAGIVGITLLVLLILRLTKPEPEEPEVRGVEPISIRTQEAKLGPFHREIVLLGSVEPLHTAQVKARVSGVVVAVSPECEPGVHVQTGQKLIRIDPEDYRLALQQAEAGLSLQHIENQAEEDKLAQAASEFDAADKELARKKQLHQDNVISDSELDAQIARFSAVKKQYLGQLARVKSSEALLDRALASRDTAALNLERTAVKAPFTGEISQRLTDLGVMLTAGAPAFEIVDYSTAVVMIDIPADFLEPARKGVDVRVSWEDDTPSRSGRLKHISPKADPQTRLFPAKVMVENPSDKTPFLPGEYVQVRLRESVPVSAMVVPFSAVSHDRKGDHVFVVDKDDEERTVARKVYVKLKTRRESLAVVEGLDAGEMLIVQGVEDLVDGAPVAERSGSSDS